MPYIPQIKRTPVLRHAGSIGDVTYDLTMQCLDFLGPDPSFEEFAQILGALEATKLELYRRSVAPYETQKARDNGDLPYPHARPIR